MHLLEIGATQSFGSPLGIHRAQAPFHSKTSSRPFFCGNEKGIFSVWKLFSIGKSLNFNFGHGQEGPTGGALLIKAVATLEPRRLVGKNSNEHLGLGHSQVVIDNSSPAAQTRSSNENTEGLDEKEKLRRTRISKANKGNTPWNKGRKHSPETLQRIRERTRLAMQDPKVKMKLVNLGHAQSEETKIKIGAAVRIGWQKRREKLHLQESCHFDWQNLIAEASRKGYDGEAELQWDSYEILKQKLDDEWLESIEIRKTTPRPKGSKRAPKSAEQKRKISEAISRKWADAAYRERVVSALARYHGTQPGEERKRRKKLSDGSETPQRSPVKKAVNKANPLSRTEMKTKTLRKKLRKSNTPSYKDPLASSKLEMIKNIRAQRATVETKKTEAIERAKLLIAEAEKAAKALEAAAAKSPIARASLIETRKLIAEAVRSIESIETEQVSSPDGSENSAAFSEDPPEMSDNAKDFKTETSPIKINGTRSAPLVKEEGFSFSNGNLSLQNDDDRVIPTNTTGYGLSPVSYETLMTISSSTNDNGKCEPNQDGGKLEKPVVNGASNVAANGQETLCEEAPAKALTVTKKWVRGRLVEVAEGAS